MSKGIFNYDFEETILMLSRHSKLKEFMKVINTKVKTLLNKQEIRNLPETTKDQLKDIRDLSDVKRED